MILNSLYYACIIYNNIYLRSYDLALYIIFLIEIEVSDILNYI